MDYIKGNTLVDYPRLFKLLEFIFATKNVPGDVAEVGVYRGGTAGLLCEFSRRHVLLFDTFTGMPEVSEIDIHEKGDFADTSLKHVASVLSGLHNYELHQGVFPQENRQYAEFRKFSLVHLDVDIYTSVRDCLEFFLPRMSAGGIIVLDDYNEPNCPGAKLAADEFCTQKNLRLEPTVQSQAIIRV